MIYVCNFDNCKKLIYPFRDELFFQILEKITHKLITLRLAIKIE